MSSLCEMTARMSRDDPEASTSYKRKSEKATFAEEDSEIQQLNSTLLEGGIKVRKVMAASATIPKFNKPNFVQNCIKWMTVCCNVDEYSEIPTALNNLDSLLKQSADYKELHATVSHFVKTKFFTKFFKYYTTFEEGWKCVESCETKYGPSCGVYHDRLKEAATALFEKKVVSKAVLRVYAALPMTGEGGVDGVLYSEKWTIQFDETLKKCNAILDDVLKDPSEPQARGSVSSEEERYCSFDTVDEELLYVLFCNYANVLRFMLLNGFPAVKSILPQKIFDLVGRCLNVTPDALGSVETPRKAKLSELLPKFHIVAHILMKFTDANLTTELNEMKVMLRISAYDNWVKWMTVSNGAGNALSNDIASSALHDLTVPAFNEKPPENDDADRARGDPDVHIRSHPLRKTLLIIALDVLAMYTKALGGTLRAQQLKEIEVFVIDRILKVHHAVVLEFPLSSSKYRYGLYSLLMELVNTRSSVWGSPVNWAVELLRHGVYDNDPKVANFCSSALPSVQNIIDQEIVRASSAEAD